MWIKWLSYRPLRKVMLGFVFAFFLRLFVMISASVCRWSYSLIPFSPPTFTPVPVHCFLIYHDTLLTEKHWHNESREAKDTWGTRCTSFKILGIKEDHVTIWSNVLKLVMMIDDPEAWALITVSGTYAIPENVAMMVQGKPKDVVYTRSLRFGMVMPTMVLHPSAAEKMLEAMEDYEANHAGSEELATKIGKVIYEAGLSIGKTTDDEGKHMMIPMDLVSALNDDYNRERHPLSEFINFPWLQGPGCCSDYPIAIQMINHHFYRLIYHFLYEVKVDHGKSSQQAGPVKMKS